MRSIFFEMSGFPSTMSHTHDEEVLTIHEVRTHLLTEAFGEKQVPAFQEILVRLTKASFEACTSLRSLCYYSEAHSRRSRCLQGQGHRARLRSAVEARFQD